VPESELEDDRPSSPSASTAAADVAPATRGHRERLQGALASATKMPDFTSIFMGGGSSGKAERSYKVPEKAFKVFDEKLRAIFMGKDPGFQDQRIRRTIATFWSNTNDPAYLRGVRENRKIEELILMMVSVATKELQKEVKQLQDKKVEPDFDWKYELNVQVGQIVKILLETVRSVSSTSPDLIAKLDSYASQLAATPMVKPPPAASASSAPASPATTKPRKLTRAGPSSRSEAAHVNSSDPADMPMVLTVGRLFGKSEVQLADDLGSLRASCTEQAAMVDLKICLKNINAGLPFPGRREDFDTEEAWQAWRQAELTHLSQLVMVMVQLNPELAKQNTSSERNEDHESSQASSQLPERLDSLRGPTTGGEQRSSGAVASNGPVGASRNPSTRSTMSTRSNGPATALDDVDENGASQSFTFIPPNPRAYYRRLIERCIDYDLVRLVNHAGRLMRPASRLTAVIWRPHRTRWRRCQKTRRSRSAFCRPRISSSPMSARSVGGSATRIA
jgi:hypothetical protein